MVMLLMMMMMIRVMMMTMMEMGYKDSLLWSRVARANRCTSPQPDDQNYDQRMINDH